MQINEMKVEDIDLVLPLYIEYYNTYEESCWTEATAKKRIKQVLTTADSFSLIMKDNNDEVCGFAMGYFKQYDDIVGYTLEKIIISYQHQNKGLGSILLATLESKVREAGAACVELQAVNDEMHEKFYSKAGFSNARNFVMKVKWFE